MKQIQSFKNAYDPSQEDIYNINLFALIPKTDIYGNCLSGCK
jgi:hypothetical protein